MDIMHSSYDQLTKLLCETPEYTVEGRLNKNIITELARRYDTGLINKLLADKYMKKLFFSDSDAGLIFKKDIFLQFISQKEFLPDSYTAFEQKIGLASSKTMLRDDDRVVLNWPYKDCILEGGQTKEDVKRNEVFFNEILAPDEINTILEDKVFTNWKRYDKDGEHKLDELKPNDNLIIKGNNLVVLHSLKKRFAGRVKLIYIDPPFNTGNDSFGYNDRFTRSTWLTFMRNRLMAAKKLLSDDGSIFIHCDENQDGYLRVLCDEIFGECNLVNEIIWRYRTYVGQVKDYFPKKHDTIFWYKKLARPEFNLIYEDNIEETVDYKRWEKYIVDGNQIKYGNHPKTDSRFTAYLKKYIKQHGQPEEGEVIYEVNGYIVDDVWEDIIALDPKNLTERTKFTGGQKPEALLERIIESVTRPGDIVLDYHLGSGTTCAVAHKLGRQYVGIEQMGYIDDITIKRLMAVVSGKDKGGITEKAGWRGGGSFVYCNIKNDANKFREKVQTADGEKMDSLLDEVLHSSFLSYRIDAKNHNVKLSDFHKLSLADKKHVLLDLIDNNTLYLNYSEIDDATYKVSDEDKKHNKAFYGE